MLSFIKSYKWESLLGLAYVLAQLGAIFFQNILWLIVYIILYFGMILLLAKRLLEGEGGLGNKIKLVGLANIILFLIYIPLFALNPEINWYLKGERAFDPMLLYVVVPIFLFLFGAIVLWAMNLGYNLFTSSK